MKAMTAQDAAHVLLDVTAWAPCVKVFKADGESVRMTSHDRNLTVALVADDLLLNGTYESVPAFNSTHVRSSSDLAVDNLEIDSILDDAGITQQEIRAGVFNDVRYVLFLVNWKDPTNSGLVLKRGVVGQIRDFLTGIANIELRGLTQYLQQVIVEAVGPTCRAQLGDARCKVNLVPLTQIGVVSGITVQRRVFESTLDGSPATPAGWCTGGKLTWTSGANLGLSMEVKEDAGGGDLSLFEPLAYDITIGDTFTLPPGCDKVHQVVSGIAIGDCFNKFNNVLNNQSEPHVPSQDSLIEAAD